MRLYHAWLGTPSDGVPTFRQFVETGWRDAQDIAGMKAGTREFYDYAIRSLLPKIGDRALNAFTAAGIESLALELQREGKSSTTCRSYSQVVLRVLRAAVDREVLPEMPIKRRVRLPKAARPQNLLTPEQEVAFFETMTPEFRALAICARTTGIRKSDLSEMRWVSVDFDAGTISITQKKTGARVVVPVLAATREVLTWCRTRPVRASDGRVFLDRRGRPWTKQTIKDCWAAAKKRAGLEAVPFRFHDLRHAHGTSMAEANLQLPVIAAMLGHKDLKSSQRYIHTRADAMVECARAALETKPVTPPRAADSTAGSSSL